VFAVTRLTWSGNSRLCSVCSEGPDQLFPVPHGWLSLSAQSPQWLPAPWGRPGASVLLGRPALLYSSSRGPLRPFPHHWGPKNTLLYVGCVLSLTM
jgi:hypothetical protein